MPSTLKTLILPCNTITDDNISSLPSSLTCVDSSDRKSRCFTLEALKLKFQDENGSILPNLLELGVSLYPSHFSELYSAIGEKWSLPIKEIQVLTPPHDYRTPTARAFFEFPVCSRMFPPTLTRLKTGRIDWHNIPDSSIWSPSLTHIELDTYEYLRNVHFPKLPRGLVTLRWYGPVDLGTFGYPYSDTDAMDSGRICLEGIDAEKWSQVRVKLNAYGDTLLDKDRREELEDYISEVERGALFGLPVTLEELSFRFIGCQNLTMGLLPPLVTHAEILQKHSTAISPVSLVPPFLTSLKLNMHCTLAQGRYDAQRTKGLHYSNVRELELVGSGFLPAMHCFPHRLHKLTLNQIVELSPQVLANMPSTLRHLAATNDRTYFFYGWRDAIPAQLETFTLSRSLFDLLLRVHTNYVLHDQMKEQLARQGTKLILHG